MNNIIQAFDETFGKASTMRITFMLTVVLFGLNLITKTALASYALLICDSVFLVCLIALYISFCNHNKNVQKGLLCAVLMWYLYDQVSYVINGIIMNPDVFSVYHTFWGLAYIVLSLIIVLLYAVFFMNHFVINSDHHSRPANVLLNQLLVVAIAVCSLISVPCQVTVVAANLWEVAECITWGLGLSALVLMIAAYESRLDAYRIDREAAGWSEEKGYPEGYVHQYEKNRK